MNISTLATTRHGNDSTTMLRSWLPEGNKVSLRGFAGFRQHRRFLHEYWPGWSYTRDAWKEVRTDLAGSGWWNLVDNVHDSGTEMDGQILQKIVRYFISSDRVFKKAGSTFRKAVEKAYNGDVMILPELLQLLASSNVVKISDIDWLLRDAFEKKSAKIEQVGASGILFSIRNWYICIMQCKMMVETYSREAARMKQEIDDCRARWGDLKGFGDTGSY